MKKEKEVAAAIKYDQKADSAPVVIAKGRGYIAKNIKEIAKSENIPTYQDEKLAEQLYHLSIGKEIPPELYQVVAEVLAFIIQLDIRKEKNDGK